jgi:predicted NBD/HSP70 family sugar kinase
MPALLKETPFDSWHSLIDQLHSSSAAKALLNKEAKYLSVALLNAINMLGIEMVILKGDIAYNSQALRHLLHQRVAGRIACSHARSEVLITSGEASCSVRTAAASAIHAYFNGSLPALA